MSLVSGVERDPRPHVAVAPFVAVFFGDVARLGGAKGPDLVALDPRRGEVDQMSHQVSLANRAQVHHELKRRQQSDGRTLGQLASELLAAALQAEPPETPQPHRFRWTARKMDARIDLEDKEAVRPA